MSRHEIIGAFTHLGQYLQQLDGTKRAALYQEAALHNAWFTSDNTDSAIQALIPWLQEPALKAWSAGYGQAAKPRTVGIAMAGNIPLVGFHDLLCILVAGHRAKVKLSSQDTVLMRHVIQVLGDVNEYIELASDLKNCDAVIATGSDNTSRTFEYYFRHIPHIIRKNRVSVGILMGEEAESELKALGKDVFSYFGLGCRNVSKVYAPIGYDLPYLLDQWTGYAGLIDHHKYSNNYTYQRSILMVNSKPFLDTGYLVVVESASLASPIACLHVEYYDNQDDLRSKLSAQQEKLQCVLSARGWYPGSIPFGQSQHPGLADYADGVNTMSFLASL